MSPRCPVPPTSPESLLRTQITGVASHDITGTTPPYDQTIVLGPSRAEQFCRDASAELGVDVAIVDVNDLGRVKVLASSPGCDEGLLGRALRPNPAGNANERTPLVLVRPGLE